MTSNRSHPGLRKLLGTLLATTALLSTGGQGAAAQPYGQPYAPAAQQGAVQDVVADSSGYGGQLAVPMGGSRILRFTRPIGQVMVGNPKVGDVIPLGDRTLYVLGKGQGATSLTVMPRGGGAPLATLDLRVGYDVDNIRRAMRQVLPGETLDVASHGDGVVLTGVLASSAAAARAASIAEQYAPGHVVNLTSIRGAEQVMLSVRVAEVQRTALQQLGLNNINALWDKTGSLTFAAPILNTDAVLNLIGRSTSGDWTFQTLFDALEKKGFASTLAEPNLVALSGETAVFFAGGEFPIPVPQAGVGGANTITIEYKQYGVSIGFTPTVFGDTINLAIAPEVSALDPANSIVLQGFRIPGITTRRAKTTVELRNGQSFAIAGLIRREFSDNMRGLPGASRMPVFGALFRSTGYQNNETEVVIIVTAHLAKPTDGRNLLAPTDVTQGPSGASLYLSGSTDRPVPTDRPMASLAAPQAQRPAPVAAVTMAPAPPQPVVAAPVTIVAASAPTASPPAPPMVAATMAPAPLPAPKPVVAAPVTMAATSPPTASPPNPAKVAAPLPAIVTPAPTALPAPAQRAATVASATMTPAPLPAPKPVVAAPVTMAATSAAPPPKVPATTASVSPPAAAPAQVRQAAAAPVAASAVATKPAVAPQPVAAPKPASAAEPITVDMVAAAKPVTINKLATTAARPALTPISNPAASPAVGR
ncbi:pilus assembly protein N-terminal domain-containing protein [Phenylobacterium sp. LjRoot225]|uniref:type II and III secretion system protein family protein n=1 Tax=Phenylobacterium sp. LjRoot225 TaxID=3342285 RepID=UPI003ECCD572